MDILIVGTPDFDCGCARRYGENFRLLHDNTHISRFSQMKVCIGCLQITDFQNSRERNLIILNSKYFTKENLLRLFDTEEVSPPFYGNIMTKYCEKLSMEERI